MSKKTLEELAALLDFVKADLAGIEVYMFIKSDIFSIFIAANIYFIVIIVVIVGSNTESFCCTVFYF